MAFQNELSIHFSNLVARVFLIRGLTGAIDAPLLFLGRWRERGAGGLLPRWQEVRGEVIRSEIFLADHLCKYKNYACLWKNTICFAYFFFKRGAGGLLRRWQEVREEVIRRGGVTPFRRGCVKLLNTPSPPPYLPPGL